MGDIELGIRLKKAREKAGLKQQDVCDKIGIPKVQTLSAYERGINSPNLETLKQFCLLFDVSADSLLFGNDKLPTREKSKAEYAKQLVEAVDHLGLVVEDDGDRYGYHSIFTAFNRTKYEDFNIFSHKWLKFRELLDNGTIELDEYKTLLVDRLNTLEMVESMPEEESSHWDDLYDGQLPF